MPPKEITLQLNQQQMTLGIRHIRLSLETAFWHSRENTTYVSLLHGGI
jgi:hypothetical protein